MAVIKTKFGQMPDGREISLYQMTNQKGVQASVTDLGAIWVGLLAPDREGKFSDVLLGYDDASGYLKNGPHFGSVVGRIANRTAKARLSFHLGCSRPEPLVPTTSMTWATFSPASSETSL